MSNFKTNLYIPILLWVLGCNVVNIFATDVNDMVVFGTDVSDMVVDNSADIAVQKTFINYTSTNSANNNYPRFSESSIRLSFSETFDIQFLDNTAARLSHYRSILPYIDYYPNISKRLPNLVITLCDKYNLHYNDTTFPAFVTADEHPQVGRSSIGIIFKTFPKESGVEKSSMSLGPRGYSESHLVNNYKTTEEKWFLFFESRTTKISDAFMNMRNRVVELKDRSVSEGTSIEDTNAQIQELGNSIVRRKVEQIHKIENNINQLYSIGIFNYVKNEQVLLIPTTSSNKNLIKWCVGLANETKSNLSAPGYAQQYIESPILQQGVSRSITKGGGVYTNELESIAKEELKKCIYKQFLRKDVGGNHKEQISIEGNISSELQDQANLWFFSLNGGKDNEYVRECLSLKYEIYLGANHGYQELKLISNNMNALYGRILNSQTLLGSGESFVQIWVNEISGKEQQQRLLKALHQIKILNDLSLASILRRVSIMQNLDEKKLVEILLSKTTFQTIRNHFASNIHLIIKDIEIFTSYYLKSKNIGSVQNINSKGVLYESKEFLGRQIAGSSGFLAPFLSISISKLSKSLNFPILQDVKLLPTKDGSLYLTDSDSTELETYDLSQTESIGRLILIIQDNRDTGRGIDFLIEGFKNSLYTKHGVELYGHNGGVEKIKYGNVRLVSKKRKLDVEEKSAKKSKP